MIEIQGLEGRKRFKRIFKKIGRGYAWMYAPGVMVARERIKRVKAKKRRRAEARKVAIPAPAEEVAPVEEREEMRPIPTEEAVAPETPAPEIPAPAEEETAPEAETPAEETPKEEEAMQGLYDDITIEGINGLDASIFKKVGKAFKKAGKKIEMGIRKKLAPKEEAPSPTPEAPAEAGAGFELKPIHYILGLGAVALLLTGLAMRRRRAMSEYDDYDCPCGM